MELAASIIPATLYPTAAFVNPPNFLPQAVQDLDDRASSSILEQLAPSDSVPSVKWRIDGTTNFGIRFFTSPDFAVGRPPLRIDTWIPDPSAYSPALRASLQSSYAVLIRDESISALGISQYILKALEVWSSSQHDFESKYSSMPFGSRIVFENISASISNVRIHLIPDYGIEHRWLSMEKLQLQWQLPETAWPEVVDWGDLQWEYQLHDSISLVRIKSSKHGSGTFVFKALTTDSTVLYHELKLLLTTPPHPNIISKPLYIVTKKCRFGGKHGVCGFILEYHSSGTLSRALESRRESRLDRPPSLGDFENEFRWAKQITSALIHIKESSPDGFYSDLRPNNTVMAQRQHDGRSLKDAVLVDFEQRGNWYSWSPPEINYLQYLEWILSSPTDLLDGDHHIRARCTKLLNEYVAASLSDTEVLSLSPNASSHEARYERDLRLPWLLLRAPHEREAAQVYMLGKMLWCLFEGFGFLNDNLLDLQYVKDEGEDDARLWFPAFKRTPEGGGLRECIKRCTAGATEWMGREPSGIVRKGTKLYARGRAGEEGQEKEQARKAAQDAARQWWMDELVSMERFLKARISERKGDGHSHGRSEDITSSAVRPRLSEIMEVLVEAEAAVKAGY
jgi:hypothetical protein